MGIKNIIGELRVNGKPVLTEKYSEGLSYASNEDGTCYVKNIGTCTDTDIIIPSTYEGKLVTTINSRAFYDCTSLTSVVIPDSVTSIGYSAFWGCTGLTSIVIPDSVTSISDTAFWGCTGLTSIVIPDGVTSIREGILYNCTNLISVVIPGSVTTIIDYAFGGCTSLKNVYYTGSEGQWNNIPIGASNENLTNAAIHYNYADDFISVNDRLGDVSSVLDLLIAQTNALIGGAE